MTSPAVSFPAPFSKEHHAWFSSRGYLLVHDFLPPENISDLRTAITECCRHQRAIKVRWPHSIFDTLNDSEVDENFPELRELYDTKLLGELSRLCSVRLATIADRRVGLSINLTAPGGKFQAHYDRNIMTAILYVNDDYDGGEMTFYPRVRFYLGQPTRRSELLLQLALDRIVRNPLYLRALARRVVIKPRAGDLLIFEGTRTLHSVLPVESGSTRLSIQFAYDHPGTVFDVSDYYGR